MLYSEDEESASVKPSEDHFLKPKRGGKELIERIDKRITALSYHIYLIIMLKVLPPGNYSALSISGCRLLFCILLLCGILSHYLAQQPRSLVPGLVQTHVQSFSFLVELSSLSYGVLMSK